MTKILQRWAFRIITAVIILYFLYSYVLPIFTIFRQSFGIGSVSLEKALPSTAKILVFTIFQALLSTILTLLAGLPGALVFSRYRFRGKRICRSLVSIPFMLPTVVVAAGMSALLGQNGWLNLLLRSVFSLKESPIQLMNTFAIILLAHVFYNTSLVIRMVGNSWASLDKSTEDAAKTLGASGWNLFWRVTLPMLKPSILSASLMVFLFDFTSYGVILLLGGARYKTLEVEISYQTMQTLNLQLAALLSLIQLTITTCVVWLEKRVRKQELEIHHLKVYDENLRSPQSGMERVLVFSVIALLMIFTLLPLLSLIFRSCFITSFDTGRMRLTSGFSLIYYKQLFLNAQNSFFFVPPIQAIWNSCRNAFLCMALSILAGLLIVLAGRKNPRLRSLDGLFVLPIGTSAVTLGLGYLVFYRQNMLSLWIIPLAHSIIALPFVIRTLQPAFDHIPESLRQSASLLGARPMTVFFRMDLPLIRSAIINSAVFSFTISMGEFGASSFLSRPENPTLTVAIYNFLGKPGGLNYGQAMAMSTLLLVFCFAAVGFINRSEE